MSAIGMADKLRRAETLEDVAGRVTKADGNHFHAASLPVALGHRLSNSNSGLPNSPARCCSKKWIAWWKGTAYFGATDLSGRDHAELAEIMCGSYHGSHGKQITSHFGVNHPICDTVLWHFVMASVCQHGAR